MVDRYWLNLPFGVWAVHEKVCRVVVHHWWYNTVVWQGLSSTFGVRSGQSRGVGGSLYRHCCNIIIGVAPYSGETFFVKEQAPASGEPLDTYLMHIKLRRFARATFQSVRLGRVGAHRHEEFVHSGKRRVVRLSFENFVWRRLIIRTYYVLQGSHPMASRKRCVSLLLPPFQITPQ
jgi:hypothetical protein